MEGIMLMERKLMKIKLMVILGIMQLGIKRLLRQNKRVLGLINSRIKISIKHNEDQEEEEWHEDEENKDTDDVEYIPEEVADNADDIHFTNSDDELDLNDNGFGVEGLPVENASADKGKWVVNDNFNGDDGEENDMDDLHPVGGYDRDEDDEGDDEAEVRMYTSPLLI
ncbi:hypothetical protein PIB30_024278 [Stylosanthes scabra]|uniref:Uncharacterized protein n=1 Tax=Stylosanthes scabra TaxID=79078 RepID=A0ABU6V7V7_9FABA|nr:hypothetical protein [Stylosanthes scabra]